MAGKVAPAGLGGFESLAGGLLGRSASDILGQALTLSTDVGLDVLIGLFNVASNVEGIARGLWDGQAVWMLMQLLANTFRTIPKTINCQ